MTGCSDKEEPLPENPGRVLVLMYHRIVKDNPGNEYERRVTDLETDLRYFRDNNINVISFNDLINAVKGGELPSGNSVILTFDDGDESWYTLVRPLLLKYNMRATFFLWTYMIGNDSFMSWNEVENMGYYTPAEGERPFIFGSHSYSHAYLLQRKSGFATDEEYKSFLDYEFGQSKKIIEQHVPDSVTAFSLPFGDGAGNAEIIAAAQRNGYKFIRTSSWNNIKNSSVDLLNVPSLPVLDTTTVKFIRYYLDL